MFQAELTRAGYGSITTEIAAAGPFYYAEPYHQQYLAANPNGYCGLGGTGVSCPAPLRRSEPGIAASDRENPLSARVAACGTGATQTYA
jgi:hypothetical protein